MRFHLVIGVKDADIAYWIDSLPHGSFNRYINAILESEFKKRIAMLPIPYELGLSERRIDTTIYFDNKQIEELVLKIKKNKRSNFVKKTIRKHITVNYQRMLRLREESNNADNNIPNKTSGESNTVTDTATGNLPESESTANDFVSRMKRMTNR